MPMTTTCIASVSWFIEPPRRERYDLAAKQGPLPPPIEADMKSRESRVCCADSNSAHTMQLPLTAMQWTYSLITRGLGHRLLNEATPCKEWLFSFHRRC